MHCPIGTAWKLSCMILFETLGVHHLKPFKSYPFAQMADLFSNLSIVEGVWFQSCMPSFLDGYSTTLCLGSQKGRVLWDHHKIVWRDPMGDFYYVSKQQTTDRYQKCLGYFVKKVVATLLGSFRFFLEFDFFCSRTLLVVTTNNVHLQKLSKSEKNQNDRSQSQHEIFP